MKFISRFFATSVIRIKDGSAHCTKGKLMNRLLRDITILANEANISEGEIWMNQAWKVSFSSEIPEQIRQRMRNVISSR